jgi:hypothetical protein
MTIEQFLEEQVQSQARTLGTTIRMLADCRIDYNSLVSSNDIEALKQEIMDIMMETDHAISMAAKLPDLYALSGDDPDDDGEAEYIC